MLVPAQRAYAVSCTSSGYGRGTETDTQAHFGTGGNVAWRSISSTGCPVVRSLYIWSDSNNEAEVGWYQDGSAGSITKCDVVTTPHVFVWANYNGYYKCESGTSAFTSSSPDWFSLQEPQHDGNVYYYWNTTYLGFYNNNFTQGLSWAYDEIHDSQTAGNFTAGFAGLVYYGNAGNPNNWYQEPIDTWTVTPPSGYKYCDYSPQHWKEILSTNSC